MANILKASLLSAIAAVVSLAAGFLCNIAAARLLGPAGSGSVAFAIYIATSATAVADLGLAQIVLRGSGQGDVAPGIIRTAIRSFARSVALVGMVILGFALWEGAPHSDEGQIWLMTAILFVSYAFSAFSTAVSRSRHRFGQVTTTAFIGGLLQIPGVALGAWLWGVPGALVGHTLRFLPQALVRQGYFTGPRAPLTPEMRRHGRGMWLSDIIDILVLSRIEFLFLALYFSTVQIGHFAAGLSFAGLIEQVALQLSPALVVGFVHAHTQQEREGLRRTYAQSMRMLALAVLPVSLGGAAIMPALIPVVFGPAFVPAVPSAVILMGTVWLVAFAIIPWGMVSAVGESAKLLRIQVISGILTLVLLAVVVPWAGLQGAAWSRTAVNVVTLLMLLGAVRRLIGPALPLGVIVRNMVAALLCALAAAVPVALLDDIPALVVAVPAGGLAYAVALRLLRVIDAEAAERLIEKLGAKLPAASRPILERLAPLLAPR
jgi:O-antigen/teichoic acid export membrane protein